jgi:hypothetical protein
MQVEAGQIFNLFTAEELNLFLSVLGKLPDTPNTGKFKAYTNGFTSSDIIYQIFNRHLFKKLDQTLNRNIKVKCGMYLREVEPWDIHTDYQHPFDQGDNPDLAILIPLKIVSDTQQTTHTVVFNELCQTNFKDFKLSHNKLTSHAKNLHQTHCGHCDADDLEYVSLNGVYAWTPGSLIYWDRKMLHCSDNFLKNHIREKQALVLFTGR